MQDRSRPLISIPQLLAAEAQRAPDAAALGAPCRRPLTYGGLFDHARRVAADLHAMGIGRGDRVATVVRNGPEVAAAVLAVASTAVAAPLNPAYRAREFDFFLNDLNAAALLIDRGSDSPARAAAAKHGVPVIELCPRLDDPAGLFTLAGSRRDGICAPGAPRANDAALVLYTSGTTARPKAVALTHAQLLASAANIGAALALTEHDRSLNVMPLFHIHGLVGAVLSSLAAGGAVVCAPDFYAPEFFHWLEECRATWYTAAPAIHRAIATRASGRREIFARAPLRFIRSCSAALPEELAGDLEKLAGVPLVDAYGMTEACHQIASTPLGRRKPGSVGVAAGPELRIVDEQGRSLPAESPGEIVIRGESVIGAYAAPAEANRGAFTDGWLRTGDQGYLDRDGYLYITGRLKELINRGGEKISPLEIEATLCRHPAVARAAVFAAPEPRLGEEVAVAVVLRAGAELPASELRGFASEHLADFKVPTRVVFVPELPAGPTGKIERAKLAGLLGLGAPEARQTEVEVEDALPSTLLEGRLAALWSRTLGVERVGSRDDFFALGGDSILAARLLSRVRAEFHTELPLLALFEAPTIAAMARRIESSTAAPMAEIARSPLDGPAPLSRAQERLWFLDQLVPGSPLYNRPLAYGVDGRLDTRALERALAEIVARHAILRARFLSEEGRPFQTISRGNSFTLRFLDLRDVPAGRRRAESERAAVDETDKPFDLKAGPPIHATLMTLDENEHVLLLVIHHIVFDGWSEAVFLRELALLYDAFCRGEPSPLEPLPIQYVDYAAWQRGASAGEALENQLAYWKRRLSGVPALALPTDRPRPPRQTFRGAREFFTLPKTLADDLKALGRREGVTLFMTLAAAFQTLLYRYTGQEDIAVGAPVAGRSRVELEGLIGAFINIVVLRGDLSGDPEFTLLLDCTRAAALGAYENQDVPFETLVQELRPERDPSRAPLFQAMLVMENTPRAALEFAGLRLRRVEAESATSKFDLTLSITDDHGALAAGFEYNTDLFDAATITRMAGHFHVLLAGIAADPSRRVSRLPLLTDAEARRFGEWNGTEKKFPGGRCVHELIEERAARRPDDVAVVFEESRLTYGELNRLANRLAHYLRKRGVRAEVPVAISVERSCDLIVGIVAILKAGGAYVPLDPDYPSERCRFMMSDANARLLVTRGAIARRLGLSGAPAVCVDDEREAIAREPETNPRAEVAPDHAAYIIYTSGSTGRPKGVLVAHRALANYLCVLGDAFNLAPGDRALQFSSIGFDSSVEEIFHPLARGATLVLRNDAVLQSPRAFLEACRDWELTLVALPTAYWHELAAALAGGEVRLPEGVRVVHIGGERIVPERAAQWRASVGDRVRLVNGYGPTEATVVSAMCDVRSGHSGGAREIPIGRPIANARIHILDKHLNRVPLGVPGELYIGGAGLARGYVNSPDLTAEKFLPDPFSAEPGARLYRTGDLARYLPDGNIEFLGRVDDQMKIRGFRIEPGEIEAVLRRHASVGDAVVIATEDNQDPHDRRLIAYVFPSGEKAPAAGELREFVRAHLPDYMVPAAFVPLASLPLTPNGKIDRRALPELSGSATGAEFVEPRGVIERTLANIWSEVLRVERVGAEDRFFHLGGHSLHATQVAARMRAVFGIEVALRTLFDAPTIAELARIVETAMIERSRSKHEENRGGKGDRVFPMSFAQERLWFLDQLEPGNPVYNMPAAFRLRGPLDRAALEQGLDEIVRRHEALRTTFMTIIDERPVQVVAPELKLELSVIDLTALDSGEQEARVERLIAEETRHRFNLARGPLVRSRLLRLELESHILLLNLHHIVADGWSLGVLCRELAGLYRAFSSGKPSPLPELLIQYADSALRERNRFAGKELERQLSYWRERLAGAPQLEFPTDFPRPAVQTHRGASESFALPAGASDALRVIGRRREVTPFMTLLAAFAVLLRRYTGEDDIVVGAPIAGRRPVEVEGLIGLFLNNLVLRLDVSGDPGFEALLARVRRETLDAYAHQDLPFEKLVEALSGARDLSRAPLFQVCFNMVGPEIALELAGLEVEMVPCPERGAKFDFTCYVTERDRRFCFELRYNSDLFSPATMARMAAHFRTLLEAIAANPQERLSRLPLLTAAERKTLLREWNDTASGASNDRCIHELFEDRVERTPDAVVAIFEAENLTYRELNRRANRLAHYLGALGVTPETTVGVCLNRSLEMLVAVLAVLKSGGAYVPLDPAWPKDRLYFMVDEARIGIVLTGEPLQRGFSDFEGRALSLDRDAPLFDGCAETNPAPAAKPNNLAYVIYTSGSTGKPKGVLGAHRGVVNYFSYLHATYGLSAADTVLQLAPLSFDASVRDLIAPLTMGARVVVVNDIEAKDPAALGAAIREHGVTCVLSVVPTMLNAILEAADRRHDFESLRLVLVSGEALSTALCRKAQEAFGPSVRIVNQYGPTEATLTSTFYPVLGADGGRSIVPLGKPIRNVRIYILDGHLNAAPIGIAGEIHIGGVGLARGYLKRPELTAEKFVPDPFSEEPGARLHKTGDRARYLPDGNIEFLGRLDHQVKIRGFRVELEEIEAVLRQHALIREAVVAAREEAAGLRLAAYIAPVASQVPDAADLREFLAARLPDYMVPSVFTMLDAVPLTANGKVNRRALPDPDQGRPELENLFVAPRSSVEETLAEIWTRLLRLERIGVHDNFFDLGGHSLLATQVIARARDAFQVELPLRTLFDAPTIAGIAEVIQKDMDSGIEKTAPEISRVSRPSHRVKAPL